MIRTMASPTPPLQSAKVRWSAAVDAAMSSGMDRRQAVLSVERSHPGLRQQMLNESNQ
jgi:hypothetical protein